MSLSKALKQSLRIGVVGAGITGLLTTRLLLRAGFTGVETFDSSPSELPSSPTAFQGVQITPSAFHALRLLDPPLALALENAGAVAVQSGTRSADGSLVSCPIAPLARPSLWVSREAFLTAIRAAPLTPLTSDAVSLLPHADTSAAAGQQRSAIAVQYNHTCAGYTRVTEAVTIGDSSSSNPSSASADSGPLQQLPSQALQLHFFGRDYGVLPDRAPYHLVIAADGLYSALRQHLQSADTGATTAIGTGSPRGLPFVRNGGAGSPAMKPSAGRGLHAAAEGAAAYLRLRRGVEPVTVLVQGYAKADDVAALLTSKGDSAKTSDHTSSNAKGGMFSSLFSATSSLFSTPQSDALKLFTTARDFFAHGHSHTPKLTATDTSNTISNISDNSDVSAVYKARTGAAADGSLGKHPQVVETVTQLTVHHGSGSDAAKEKVAVRWGYVFNNKSPLSSTNSSTAVDASDGCGWVHWWAQVPESLLLAGTSASHYPYHSVQGRGLSSDSDLPPWTSNNIVSLTADLFGTGKSEQAASSAFALWNSGDLSFKYGSDALLAALMLSSSTLSPEQGTSMTKAYQSKSHSATKSVDAHASGTASDVVCVVAAATGELPYSSWSEQSRWPSAPITTLTPASTARNADIADTLSQSRSQSQRPKSVVSSPLLSSPMPAIVTVGHAAHSLLPEGGQDTAMCIEDAVAVTLATHLATLLAERDWNRDNGILLTSANDQDDAQDDGKQDSDSGYWSSGDDASSASKQNTNGTYSEKLSRLGLDPASPRASARVAAHAQAHNSNCAAQSGGKSRFSLPTGAASPSSTHSQSLAAGKLPSPLPVPWCGAWPAARVRACRQWRVEAEATRARNEAATAREQGGFAAALNAVAARMLPLPVRQAEYKKAYHISVLEDFPELKQLAALAKL